MVSNGDQTCRTGCGRPWPCGCGPSPLSQVEPGGGGFETTDERRIDELEQRVDRLEMLIAAYRLAECSDPREHFAQQAQRRIRSALINEGRWICQIRGPHDRNDLARFELKDFLEKLGV